jgi:stress response protein SCP2
MRLSKPSIFQPNTLGSEMLAGPVVVTFDCGSMADVDLGCYLLDECGALLDTKDFIFYGNLGAPGLGVQMGKDDRISFDEHQSAISLNAQKLSKNAAKVMFVASLYNNEEQGVHHIGHYDLIIHKDGQNLHKLRFDLNDVNVESLVILGVLDVKNRVFMSPGVPLYGDFATLAEFLYDKETSLMSTMSPDWPNFLSGQVPANISPQDLMLHIAWGSDESRLKNLAQLPTPFSTEAMKICQSAWHGSKMLPGRVAVIRNLISRGADWHSTLPNAQPNVGKDPRELVRSLFSQILGSSPGQWELAILTCLDKDFLMPFIIQASAEENDVLFHHLGHKWLLNHTSEVTQASHLEEDLGL